MDGVDAGGGSLGLAGLIDQYGEELAHDLLHHYGLDLRDAVADILADDPKGSPGWLLALIRGLPDGSHLAAAVRGGPEHRGWTLDRYLAAATFDAVQAGTVVAARVGAGKNARRIKDPEPWPRPGAKRRTKTRTLAQLMAQQKRTPKGR